MRKHVNICAATFLLCILACCAPSPPPVPGDIESGEVLISAVDSMETASYDFLFVQLHTDILAAIETKASKDSTVTNLVEIRSIVEAAERIYLEGKYYVAIELLAEAEELLRNIP